MLFDGEDEGGEVNVTRQLSVFKHIKKKAANDAQLLMYVSTHLRVVSGTH